MDVVYILGSGSLVKNEEIRYSVRSLEKYMADLGRIFIVGDDPGMLPLAVHIPASDTSVYKWQNGYHKVKKACAIEGITEEFLLMNDDFFMLEPFLGAEWPFYSLKNGNGGPCGPLDFGLHCPMRINAEWYDKMPFDASGKGPLSPRTFYANFYRAPSKMSSDFVIRVGAGARSYDEQIVGKPCFSIGNTAPLDDNFMHWLDSLYPEPSTFEI